MPTPEPFLVVIDMQVAFAEPDSVWVAPRYGEITPVVTELGERFSGRVVYTRFVRDPQERGSWRPYYDRWSTMREGPESSIWDVNIPMQPGAPVVSLPTFSKWGPDLAAIVGPNAPLVLCGVATDCCVLGTAYGAADAGRSVTVVADACAGATDEAHDQALALLRMLDPMVSVRTSTQL